MLSNYWYLGLSFLGFAVSGAFLVFWDFLVSGSFRVFGFCGLDPRLWDFGFWDLFCFLIWGFCGQLDF